MYISDLNIHGFKSFAKKDKLIFGAGITAIVGPNGCGKTNIVDAIRWVLGEQKYSVLRSGKMGDVIFKGTESMKPLSLCEVSLTVHNNKGKLPVEYNDIEIGRRIFRNGESEYFINRNPCRLKDIQDLFMDSGMGASVYSVIELKMIEQILSETTDDRKRMFEEAAGINKYKQQRKATLCKFEAVHTDLERINDILLEVENKVKTLELQLKRFKRHEKLTLELREKDIALAFLKRVELLAKADPLRKKIGEIKQLRDSTATETSIHENELEQLKMLYKQQQIDVNKLGTDVAVEEKKRDELQRLLLIAAEQRRSTNSTTERLRQEKETNTKRTAQLAQQIREYDNEIVALQSQINDTLSIYKKEKAAFEIFEKQYNRAQTEVAILQDRRWEKQRKLADQASRFKRTEDMLSDNKNRLNNLKKKETELESGLLDIEKNLQANTKILAALKQQREQQELALHEITANVRSLQQAEQEADRKIHGLQTQQDGLQNQIQFYEHLLESKEGFDSGVKYVLDNVHAFSGVYGVCAELLEVEKEYQNVIESILGSNASCLVSKDRKTALQILFKLQQEQQACCSILPLKELETINSPTTKIPQNDLVLTAATHVVRTDKKYRSLVQLLLGRVLIVTDLSRALNDSVLAKWDLVDMNGTFAGTNLILSQKKKGSRLVGRKERLQTLQKELQKNEQEQARIARKRTKIKEQLPGALAKSEAVEEKLNKIMNHANSAEINTLQFNLHHDQYRDTLNGIVSEIADVTATISSLKAELKKLAPATQKSETQLAKLTSGLAKSNQVLIDIRTQRDGLHKQVQDLRVDVLNLESQRENLSFQKRTATETAASLTTRQKTIEQEIIELLAQQEELEKQVDEGDNDLQKVKALISKKRSLIALKKETVQETYSEIEAIQENIRAAQLNQETLLENVTASELEVSGYEQKIELISERIKERYGTHIPETMQLDQSSFEIKQRIVRITSSLENIGPINMAVKNEHETENERLRLLHEQKADLLNAEGNLKETIQAIDQEARSQFMDTFDQIKVNFEKLFSMFFEGGKGSLSLIGNPDPLDADIAISAQPPGKKNDTLRMLSAGEKSLTAIALLFAIYQYKPCPYCIFDEVDAPLDDVNIRKFTKVLQAFCDETQFIVVTHNKLTMESANYLFGVTMEEKGVSKLVSVKFDA